VYSAVRSSIEIQPTPQRELVEQPEATTSIIEVKSTQHETSITQSVEIVGPAVVTILGIVPGQTTIFGQAPDQSVSGSGVIISEEGYILTNNHVVENTKQVSVILADGEELDAEVIGTDVFSDLAVLRAEGQMPAVAVLGNSDALRPGETVIAIGSPLGDFKNTVTVGVVSATERVIDTGAGYQMEGLIQTDAAINQGNSGGPLVNLAGEVIGINTLIVRGSGVGGPVAEGLGFSVPSNTVLAVSEQIIEKGYFSYPYMGVRWQWISQRLAQRYNLPIEHGAYVTFVEPGSPADEAGVEIGDIITQIGERILDEENPFINALYAHSPGETISLGIMRNTTQLSLEVTLAEHSTP
jgi:2-alkenal reductase